MDNQSLLDTICLELDYTSNPGFFDLRNFESLIIDRDLGKMHWFNLSRKLGAEKIFFIDDFPIALFFNFQSSDANIEEKIYNLHLEVWNMSRPPLFFVALPDEIRVYSAYKKPLSSFSEWNKKERWLKRLDNLSKIAELFTDYSCAELETERLFKKKNIIEATYRADSCLLNNLKLLRKILEDKKLNREYAHALIGRSIFVRYMEDRKILVNDYFAEVSNNRAFDFLDVLENKTDAYNLFKKLKADFNGDMFPMSYEEEAAVTDEHIKELRTFLNGETLDSQQELFFWAYRFDIIPTELISNIYEEFYHKKGDDKKGTHYTPAVLVEFVLSESLIDSRLEKKPKILDPACGSGIFLVEAFRRIVFYERNKSRNNLSPNRLIKIIKDQIFGVDINAEALRVAAFSIYLALLDFMEPADIRANKLPKLIFDPKAPKKSGSNLFLSDAFYLTNTEKNVIATRLEKKRYEGRKKDQDLFKRPVLPIDSQQFDIIVGNPPWGEAEKKHISINWCDAFGFDVGDRELSQCFIWRAQQLVKPGGEIGLLVSTGVFFKHNENSVKFRNCWLEQNAIRAVYNFSHVRHVFFSSNSKDAISPFAAVFFSPTDKTAALTNKVFYASVKRNSLTEKLQAIVIDKVDCRKISQRMLRSDSSLWKIYLWGRDMDVQLISELETYPSLGEICNERGWKTGQGYKFSGPPTPTDELLGLPEINLKFFDSYRGIVCDPPKNLRKVHRVGITALYRGRRILIKRGLSEKCEPKGQIMARFTDEPMCFRNSMNGIRLDDASDWEVKILLGILWSSLSRYYHFLTASTWGFWHHEIHLSEYLNFPICLPEDDKLKEKIGLLVDKLSVVNEYPTSGLLLTYDPEEKYQLERDLDQAIFDLYDLSEEQRDLVNDFCKYTIDFFYNGTKSRAVISPSKQILCDYINAFQEIWNERLSARNVKLVSCIYAPEFSGLIGVSFELQDIAIEENSQFEPAVNQWRILFKRLEKILPVERSREIYVNRVFRVIDESSIFVVKRSEEILWTKSQARHDAYEFLAEVYKREQLNERR